LPESEFRNFGVSPCMRLDLLLAILAIAPFALGEDFFEPSVRTARQGEIIYFIMPDRFNDGNQANNQGDPSSRVDESGFNPADAYFFHGGDLAGIEARLDYLARLGITSIWMTPVFRNRALQRFDQGTSKAGYHGYWILDFTDVDPHFGTKDDLRRLIDQANTRGIGIILDIVVNHTADIIEPQDAAYSYQYKFSKPYLDANGKPFDDREYLNSPNFPKLDAALSFPAVPVFRNEAERSSKTPAWLNDPTVYHNRGESSTSGEAAQYGDVAGLDDLFTEQPRVVQGMIDVYRGWIENFGITGFRLDTVKHVNNEFWQQFIPALREAAARSQRTDFFIFGEIYDPDPAFLSEFVHRADMPSVLDFGFLRAARGFATGLDPTNKLADFFAKDSYYTTPNANAHSLVTFLGNHDVGRIGYFLSNDLPAASDEELRARDILAHALLLFTRGIPVIYYGDEQGFTGKGGDSAARQDMFGSKVPQYIEEKRISGGNGAAPAFDENHGLFRVIREMISVRQRNSALQSGIQVPRYAEEKPGLFAVSRIDRNSHEELLVILNNSAEKRRADIKTFSSSGDWERLFACGEGEFGLSAGLNGQLSIELPPLSVLVLRNAHPISASAEPPGEFRLTASRTSEIDDRWEIRAEMAQDQVASIAFGVRAKGAHDYKFLGTADAPPYRVFPTRETIPSAPELEFKAIARDLFNRESAAHFEWKRRAPKRPAE
jgi:glycosidase